jgi:hypothetical protein
LKLRKKKLDRQDKNLTYFIFIFCNLIKTIRFEIGLMELPERLQNRFGLYLNILPVVEKAALYGSLAVGLLLSIFAVTQVALRTSKTFASQQCHQNYNQNLVKNSVYKACEEKLTKNSSTDAMLKDNEEEDDMDFGDESSDCMNIIRRDEYELENDDALSDIDYNEINDEEESSHSSSEQVHKSFNFSNTVLLKLFSIEKAHVCIKQFEKILYNVTQTEQHCLSGCLAFD